MVYIAGPFFNVEQITLINNIRFVIEEAGLDFFSPKDECMFVPGVTTPEEVLDINMSALNKSKLLVCLTNDKDPGTMFEAGYCYSIGVPIIYIWLTDVKHKKFSQAIDRKDLSNAEKSELLQNEILKAHSSTRTTEKFNLMLGASGSVVRSMPQLFAALKEYKEIGFHRKNWGEEMNYE